MGHFVIEQWKEINIEFESKLIYSVSNLGRIKSYTNANNKQKMLKGSITEGFLFLRFKRQINNNNKYFHYAIHKVVAELFIPKENENQIYVLHLDYDKLNNEISNLQWATSDEMREHAKKSPAVIEAFKKLQDFNLKRDGEKLTSTQVLRMKNKLKRLNSKTTVKKLAKEFGVSEMQIYRIKSGENWGHLKV